MSLTDLLSNGIRAATFRAALALPLMYGCGDTTINYYSGDGGPGGNACSVRETNDCEDFTGIYEWVAEEPYCFDSRRHDQFVGFVTDNCCTQMNVVCGIDDCCSPGVRPEDCAHYGDSLDRGPYGVTRGNKAKIEYRSDEGTTVGGTYLKCRDTIFVDISGDSPEAGPFSCHMKVELRSRDRPNFESRHCP